MESPFKRMRPLARGLYLNREISSSWQKSMYALKHRSASATSSSRASVSSRNRHSRTGIFANADVFDFELSEADMALIDTMDEQLRSASIPDDLL